MVQRQTHVWVVVRGSIRHCERARTREIGRFDGRCETWGVTLKMDEPQRDKIKSVRDTPCQVDQIHRHVRQSYQGTTRLSVR